jgi:alkane 1-monooxygenase
MQRQRIIPSYEFATVLFLHGLAMVGLLKGGAWTGAAAAMSFIGLPLLDQLLGKDDVSPSAEQAVSLETSRGYRYVTYAVGIVQTAYLVACIVLWSSRDWTAWEYALHVVSTGVVTGGIGITVAHELVHRTSRIERWLGSFMLHQVAYAHFGVEHIEGHHRNVGLRSDPATARMGENVYTFIVRCVVFSWWQVWEIEADRNRRAGVAPYGVHNRMWRWTLSFPVGVVVIGLAAGWFTAVLAVAQAIIAIIMLEMVNYVEHYGLERREIKPGVLERVTAKHAWEARHRASNVGLFKLQRHADHHIAPQRRYQSLRVHDESPQLPHGYPVMLMLSLVPPLWRAVIHPRIPV